MSKDPIKLIAHRGNINGMTPGAENSPSLIMDASSRGFDVEIDIWYKDNEFCTGHDEPNNFVTFDFLNKSNYWLHCKDIQTFIAVTKLSTRFCGKYFYHGPEDMAPVSVGLEQVNDRTGFGPKLDHFSSWFWFYPGKEIKNPRSVLLNFGKPTIEDLGYWKSYSEWPYGAICSDYVASFRKIIWDS